MNSKNNGHLSRKFFAINKSPALYFKIFRKTQKSSKSISRITSQITKFKTKILTLIQSSQSTLSLLIQNEFNPKSHKKDLSLKIKPKLSQLFLEVVQSLQGKSKISFPKTNNPQRKIPLGCYLIRPRAFCSCQHEWMKNLNCSSIKFVPSTSNHSNLWKRMIRINFFKDLRNRNLIKNDTQATMKI